MQMKLFHVTDINNMGFFGNMKSINRIYGLLQEIEPLMASLAEISQSNSTDKQMAIALAGKIRGYLNELISIVQDAGNTVKCADFQFMGRKYRIEYIIAAITEIIGVVK